MPSKRNLSNRLLDTPGAAEFLNVSQASIRRWADSGLLATSRVGRRRARRFREEDLRQFMEESPGQRQVASRQPQAEIVLQGMSLPVGSHLGNFYTSDQGFLRLTLPFLRDGIRARQTSLLLASAEVQEQLLQALRAEKVNIAAALRTRLLILIPLQPSTVEERLAELERYFSQTATLRPGPMRFVGNVTDSVTALGSVAAQFRFEQQYGAVARQFPLVSLCTHDVRKLDGVAVIEALKLHYETFELHLGYFLS
jgi:excisionase family DNA binding protein